MGKFLKRLQSHSEYEDFVNSAEFVKPNVSLCKQEDEVHFNPYEILKITIEMTGGDSLIFDAGTKSDGTSLEGFVLRTGEKVQIIQGPITVHLQNADTLGGFFSFYDKSHNNYQYTTNSGGSYYYNNRPPKCHETITFTPLEDITFFADID